MIPLFSSKEASNSSMASNLLPDIRAAQSDVINLQEQLCWELILNQIHARTIMLRGKHIKSKLMFSNYHTLTKDNR
jgi:hypothetical protein